MSLADRLIEVQEREHSRAPDDTAPQGYYTDDMGYWVEQDLHSDRARFAEYVLLRCLRRHVHPTAPTTTGLYRYKGDLFINHTQLQPTANSIIMAADMPTSVSSAQAIWIYNRLQELAPELDDTKIQVDKEQYWDFTDGELKNMYNEDKEETNGNDA